MDRDRNTSMESFFSAAINIKAETREPLLKGRLNTVDLLPLTSLYKRLFKFKIIITFSQTSYITEEVNGTEPSSSGSCSLHKLTL